MKQTKKRKTNNYRFFRSRLIIPFLSFDEKRKEVKEEEEERRYTKQTTEQELYQKRRFEQFNIALKSLPEEHRRAILLRKFYGLSYKEIAIKMKISVSSIEKYIASGIKACKYSLERQGYGVQHRDISKKNIISTIDDLTQEHNNESK